jgi:hypothetical protein
MDVADGTYAISPPSNISAPVTQVYLVCTFLNLSCAVLQCNACIILLCFIIFIWKGASNNQTIVLKTEGKMYTCKSLEHSENHNKSKEECITLDVEQPIIYDSRQTVKILLPNQTRPLLNML